MYRLASTKSVFCIEFAMLSHSVKHGYYAEMITQRAAHLVQQPFAISLIIFEPVNSRLFRFVS
jgi:hypothetical protein